MFQSREVTQKSNWRDVAALLADKPEYHAMLMLEEGCSTPHDLFEEMQKAEKDLLKQHKDQFKSLVKAHQVRFPQDVAFFEFTQAMDQQAKFKDLAGDVKHLLHEYYCYKVQQKAQDKERKLVREMSDYLIDRGIETA